MELSWIVGGAFITASAAVFGYLTIGARRLRATIEASHATPAATPAQAEEKSARQPSASDAPMDRVTNVALSSDDLFEEVFLVGGRRPGDYRPTIISTLRKYPIHKMGDVKVGDIIKRLSFPSERQSLGNERRSSARED